MSEDLFIARGLGRSPLNLSFQLAIRDELICLGLFPGAIDLQVAEYQRPFSILLQKDEGVRSPKSGGVKQVGVGFAGGDDQSRFVVRLA